MTTPRRPPHQREDFDLEDLAEMERRESTTGYRVVNGKLVEVPIPTPQPPPNR